MLRWVVALYCHLLAVWTKHRPEPHISHSGMSGREGPRVQNVHPSPIQQNAFSSFCQKSLKHALFNKKGEFL